MIPNRRDPSGDNLYHRGWGAPQLYAKTPVLISQRGFRRIDYNHIPSSFACGSESVRKPLMGLQARNVVLGTDGDRACKMSQPPQSESDYSDCCGQGRAGAAASCQERDCGCAIDEDVHRAAPSVVSTNDEVVGEADSECDGLSHRVAIGPARDATSESWQQGLHVASPGDIPSCQGVLVLSAERTVRDGNPNSPPRVVGCSIHHHDPFRLSWPGPRGLGGRTPNGNGWVRR